MPSGRILAGWTGGKVNIESISSDFRCSKAGLCRESLSLLWYSSKNKVLAFPIFPSREVVFKR